MRRAPNKVEYGEVFSYLLASHKGLEVKIAVDTSELPKLLSIKRRWHVWWSPTANTFYAQALIGGIMTQMHRFICGLPSEKYNPLVVNHKDFNGINNRRYNLEVVSRSINQLHTRPRSNNTSGYLGVTWEKRRKCWQAGYQITHEDGRRGYKFVGYFSDPITASVARAEAVAARIEVLR